MLQVGGIELEEEYEKRRKWWKEERPRLSPEERKKRSRVYSKRKEKEYLESNPRVILAEAGVSMSFNSILAGLMFTASVLFFSLGGGHLHGDIVVTLTLLDTFFFVFSALQIRFLSMHVRRGEMYDAYQYHRLSFTFGTIGFLLMVLNLPLMAFFIRWELGIVVSVVIVLSFSYFGYRMYKRLFSWMFEVG